MNSIQPIWGKAKKPLKFVWRYFFTLVDLSQSINVLIFHTLLWKNALISLCIAITIDWAKQFIKLDRSFEPHFRARNPHTDIGTPIHIRQWQNPGIMGTGAYDLNRRNDIK